MGRTPNATPQNSLFFVGLQSERYLHQVLLLKLTHYERNRRTCFTKQTIFLSAVLYSTACKFTLFVPCVILAHEATSGNCEMASPTFSLTDISIRGRQTNSPVIVSGVPSRREKKVRMPDRRLPGSKKVNFRNF